MKTYSIVLSTYNKAWALPQVIDSILLQLTNDGELIIVDDGSTDDTKEVCSSKLIRYVQLNDAMGRYRNPAIARNIGYRMAKGDVIIAQSDEVVHQGRTLIPLVEKLKVGQFHIATVYDFYATGKRGPLFTGIPGTRTLFFLGALWREDLYAIGGNDEEFKGPGREDVWFGICLTRGLGLKPIYRDDIIGHHLHHKQIDPKDVALRENQKIFDRKMKEHRYIPFGCSWL